MLALCETVGCRRVQLLAYFGEQGAAVRQLRHLPDAAGVVGRHGRRAEAAVHRAPARASAASGSVPAMSSTSCSASRRTRSPSTATTPSACSASAPSCARPNGAAWSASCWPRACSRSRATTARWSSPSASAEVLRRSGRSCCGASRSVPRKPPRARKARRARRQPSPGAVGGLRAAAGLARRHRQGAGRPGVRDLPRLDPAPDRDESPSTLAELSQVTGIGENKLAKYGQQILDALGA